MLIGWKKEIKIYGGVLAENPISKGLSKEQLRSFFAIYAKELKAIAYIVLILGILTRPHDLTGWANYLPAAYYMLIFSAMILSAPFDAVGIDMESYCLVTAAFVAVVTLLVSGSWLFTACCLISVICYGELD